MDMCNLFMVAWEKGAWCHPFYHVPSEICAPALFTVTVSFTGPTGSTKSTFAVLSVLSVMCVKTKRLETGLISRHRIHACL
jgi:hypothetical protein